MLDPIEKGPSVALMPTRGTDKAELVTSAVVHSAFQAKVLGWAQPRARAKFSWTHLQPGWGPWLGQWMSHELRVGSQLKDTEGSGASTKYLALVLLEASSG